MAKGLSAAKAKKILQDGYVTGKPLTAKQKKYFGAIGVGAASQMTGPVREDGQFKNGGWLDKFEHGGSLPGASGMMYSRNSGSSAMSPPNLTKAQDGFYKDIPEELLKKESNFHKGFYKGTGSQGEGTPVPGSPGLINFDTVEYGTPEFGDKYTIVPEDGIELDEVVITGKSNKRKKKDEIRKELFKDMPDYLRYGDDDYTLSAEKQQQLDDLGITDLDSYNEYFGTSYDRENAGNEFNYLNYYKPAADDMRNSIHAATNTAAGNIMTAASFIPIVRGASVATKVPQAFRYVANSPVGRAAVKYVGKPVQNVLNYKPFGGPVSIGNTIDAGSAAYAAYATPEAYDKFKENPSFDTGLDLGLTAIDLVPFGQILTGGKNIKKAYNYTSDQISNTFRAKPKGINLETTPLRDAVTQPNMWPTSSPLPENMEPYLSKKIYPFNKEQEVFESFLSTDKQLKNIDSKSLYYNQDGKLITKGEADNLLYPPDYQKNGGEIDKAQWGKLLKWGKDLYQGINAADNVVDVANTVRKTSNVVDNAWAVKPLPGLHLKSTMDNGAISNIIEPKTGLINTEQALAIINKESGGAEKVALIRQQLGDNIPNKIDYNDFRSATQESLIPLEVKINPDGSSDYGLENIGYDPWKIEHEALTISNRNQFGTGSSMHGNPDDTLGHVHFLKDADNPNTLTITQIQSDAFQGNSKHDRLLGQTKEQLQKSLSLNKKHAEAQRKLHDLAVQDPDSRVWTYPDGQQLTNNAYKKVMDGQNNWNKMQQASIDNYSQKQLLGKNHEERYLQEVVNYAGANGNNKIRIPTMETAAKVQGFNDMQKNMGVLKKYKNQPKTIKKLYGQDVITVTDSKGNTWYEFDIPESFKSETGEIKAFKEGGSLPKAQVGDKVASIASQMEVNEEDGGRPPLGVVDHIRALFDEEGLCRDNTCVQTVKDFYSKAGIEAMPKDVYNNREFLKNFKEYGFEEVLDQKNLQPGDVLQYYYGPDSEDIKEDPSYLNFPYHMGVYVNPGEYIGDGDSKAPIQRKNMYTGTKDGKEYKKDPFRAFRYTRQLKNKNGGGVPKAQFGWLNKLYKMYKGTDKVVDAASTTGKLKYMDELSSKAKKDVYEQNYEALTKTDKETRNLGKPHIAQEEYGEGWKYSDQVDFNNPEEVAAHRKRWIASQKKGNLINDNRRFPFSDETSDIFSDLSRKDLSGSIRDGLSKRFGTIGNTYTTGYGHSGLDYKTNYLIDNGFLNPTKNDHFKDWRVGLPDGSTVPYGKLDGSVEIDPSSFNSSDEVMEELRRLAQTRMGDQFNNAFEKTSRVDFGDLLKNKNRNGGWLSKYENGGVIEDDRGQWAHPGEVTKINSNNITMKGVNYPVLGISNTGDEQLMMPGKDYKFNGDSVTEYPMAKDGKSLVELNQLTNFTNYNTPQPGGWLDKY